MATTPITWTTGQPAQASLGENRIEIWHDDDEPGYIIRCYGPGTYPYDDMIFYADDLDAVKVKAEAWLRRLEAKRPRRDVRVSLTRDEITMLISIITDGHVWPASDEEALIVKLNNALEVLDV